MKWLLIFLTASASAANLVPNSSFECGTGRGWISWGDISDSAGNSSALSGHLNSTAWHGSNSFAMGTRLLLRVFYLPAGTYTMSFYVRSSPNQTVNFGIMDSTKESLVPGNSIAATNGWQRASAQRTITTNGFYTFKAYQVSSSIHPLIDAVQVETGAVATAYSPMCQVEMAMDTTDPDNLLLSGDTKQFRMKFWNDGSAATATGQYIIYDYLNKILGSNSFSQSLPASTNTTILVDLPSKNGYMRITSRLYECNDSWDETALAVLPFAAESGQDTNGFLGTHPNTSAYHIGRERRSGYAWARDLSPATGARWSIIEPTSNNFVWNDATMMALATNSLVPICNLFPGTSPIFPVWATNADGTANWLAYSNFCFRTVARYSPSPYNIHYWETINEPYGFTTGISALTNLAVQTMVITQCVAAIRAADPAAYIIVNLGDLNDGLGVQIENYHYDMLWTNMPADIRSNINAVSTHVYPGDTDPTATEGETHISQFKKFAREFKGIKPIWNTETGAFDVGGYKTLNSLLQGNYSVFGAVASEADRWERQQRTQWSVDKQMYIALRSLGWGASVYINYWSKYFNDALVDLNTTDPTVVEFNSAEKPHGVAILMTKVMAGIGLGNITNSAATSMDAFVFTNALGTSIAVWNFDRTLKTLTLTNSSFALYDVMGNQLQTNSLTAKVTRTPQYIVSGSLTTAQLSNCVKYASVASLSDTLPPNVAFDVAPSGAWDGSGLLTLAKWSAFDENKVPFTSAGNDTNIVYKWHLDGDAYTAYSASNHAWLPAMANGNHVLYVTAMDALGNTAESAYYFTGLPVMFTNRLRIGKSVKGGHTAL